MYIFFLIWKVGEPDKSTNACPRMVQDWLNSFILDKSYKHRRLNLWFTSASSYLFCFRRTCCPSIMLCMQRFWRRNLQCFFSKRTLYFGLLCFVPCDLHIWKTEFIRTFRRTVLWRHSLCFVRLQGPASLDQKI